MKRITFLLALFFVLTIGYSQKTAEDYYSDGIKYAQRGNYKEAIAFFDKAIQLKPDDYFSIHNRGIAKSLLTNYAAAAEDFKKVLTYNPAYVAAHIALGNNYKRLTYYDTAIHCYSMALMYDTGNVEAYFHRAHMYEAMNNFDSAKADFNSAYQRGAQLADKVKFYNDTNNKPKTTVLPKITQTSTDPTYGFSNKNAIKVGTGKKDGNTNIIAYLIQLRDEKRKPVKYTRTKACCSYRPSGFKGNVNMEEYKVTYTTLEQGEKTVTLYFTFHEYSNPQAPIGFSIAAK